MQRGGWSPGTWSQAAASLGEVRTCSLVRAFLHLSRPGTRPSSPVAPDCRGELLSSDRWCNLCMFQVRLEPSPADFLGQSQRQRPAQVPRRLDAVARLDAVVGLRPRSPWEQGRSPVPEGGGVPAGSAESPGSSETASLHLALCSYWRYDLGQVSSALVPRLGV